ncbi:hypothetical protein [Streptomyces gobiensis]|uniref:hypothetical protein n=1 Tax=Streptomyces gobiensis TaxID=2875706 RepID=UPI001E2E6589|nr:hypothetical protein [Streptomyces gobiensis]UGY91379.1 hypothetical protein test1122_06355 [Streptomyces gobiensis]
MRNSKAAAVVVGSMMAVGVAASPVSAADQGGLALKSALAEDGLVCGTLKGLNTSADNVTVDLGERYPKYDLQPGGVVEQVCDTTTTLNPLLAGDGGNSLLGGLPVG